ncbi:MAG: glycosyltransferase family 2 protein [Chitinophagaceae bacterium]|nr:glycosyltransferase family 2 protein [Chitinophagaceae bacterium]
MLFSNSTSENENLFNKLEISYVVPVYVENISSTPLRDAILKYSNYSAEVLSKLQFIFVDDCSPVPIEIPDNCKLNFQLFRIMDNIPWNQGGARNIGVVHARTSKLILTDIDHVFPENILQELIKERLPKVIYKFNRSRDGQRVKPHPNTFFCTKSLFFKSLGVDEEFAGSYGYTDKSFIELQKALGTKFRMYHSRYQILHTEHANTEQPQHALSRDTNRNFQLLQKKLQLIKSKNPLAAHSRLFLNFNWIKVKEKMNGQLITAPYKLPYQ